MVGVRAFVGWLVWEPLWDSWCAVAVEPRINCYESAVQGWETTVFTTGQAQPLWQLQAGSPASGAQQPAAGHILLPLQDGRQGLPDCQGSHDQKVPGDGLWLGEEAGWGGNVFLGRNPISQHRFLRREPVALFLHCMETRQLWRVLARMHQLQVARCTNQKVWTDLARISWPQTSTPKQPQCGVWNV